MGYKDFPYLRKFAAEFAKDFRVFAYDRRGRGGSTDTKPYTVDKEVEDLAAVCREAGGRPIVAVRAVADAVPGAELVEIPKQSHAIKATALASVVRRFAAAPLSLPRYASPG